MSLTACPVCSTILHVEASTSIYTVSCPRCGDYSIGRIAVDEFTAACTQADMHLRDIPSPLKNKSVYKLIEAIEAHQESILARSIVSHVIRKNQTAGYRLSIFTEDLINILKNNAMPTPAEQADNLINLMAVRQSSAGIPSRIDDKDYGLIGLKALPHPSEVESLQFLRQALADDGFLKVKSPGHYILSLKGWQKHEEMKRKVENSKKAFIAMEFPDDKKKAAGYDYFFQEKLLDSYLIPAAQMAGYTLSNPLRDTPQAGNIHARLEVEIRTARFVVADISDANNGAYWEAGFARGLGKPVIYMCRKNAKRHFDVGSDTIIFWENDKPQEAAEALKAMIRSTLFGEAIMSDT